MRELVSPCCFSVLGRVLGSVKIIVYIGGRRAQLVSLLHPASSSFSEYLTPISELKPGRYLLAFPSQVISYILSRIHTVRPRFKVLPQILTPLFVRLPSCYAAGGGSPDTDIKAQ